MGAGKLQAHARATETVDRLPVQALGDLPIAEQRPRASFEVLNLERDEMKHVPPFVRPLVVGAATTPSAA